MPQVAGSAQTFSYSQLRNLWIQAGGNKGWSYVMAAIAMAESGGNPKAHHMDSNGSVDYGLWQINTVHNYSVHDMLNPQQNAKEAVSIFNSSGPDAWSTYKSGAYKKYMPTGKTTPSTNFGIYTSADYAGTDQGVDFSGKGIVPALDQAIITDVGKTKIVETGNKEWNYVIYRLQSGPYKGRFVYVAENFQPVVHKGEYLQAGQEIGYAPGAYPYTETGFNKSQTGWNAYGNLNGPQPAGKAMKDYIFGIIGKGAPVTSTTGVAHGGNTPGTSGGNVVADALNSIFGGAFGGIESLILQGLFIMVGIGLAMVGLGIIVYTLMGKTGVTAPGIVGMVQTQQRIGQSGARISESQRASMTRESQAGERISLQKEAAARSERRQQTSEQRAKNAQYRTTRN